MNTVPIPKFNIGQKVFGAYTKQIQEKLPCPDCLGSKEWKIITPTGKEHKCACQRCSPCFTNHDIPSLTRTIYVPAVERRTIGSVRIDTHDEHPVSYMCNETGVGSGNIYYEKDLFETEESALIVAKMKAAGLTTESDQTPQALETRHFSSFKFADAENELNRKSLWRAWHRYENLRDDIIDVIGEKADESDSSEVKLIREKMDWDERNRPIDDIAYETFLSAAILSAGINKDENLQKAINNLPFRIKT